MNSEWGQNGVEPASGDAPAAARELFVHGLLEAMNKDDPARMERRISGVLERLDQPLRLAPARRRPWRLISGLAAAVLLIVAGILGIPTERSATAMVHAAMEASRTAGDRRYDVRAVFGDETGEIHYATLDVRNPECYVIRAILSKGDDLVVGRDAQGDWALKHTGEIDRLPPRKLLPAWVKGGEGAVGMVSVDDVLGALEGSYELKRGAAAPPPTGGPTCHRVTATRIRGSGPRSVEIWLDPRTNVPVWMELYFDPLAPGAAPENDRPPPRRPRSEGGRPPPPDGRGPDQSGRPFTDPFRDRRTPPLKLIFQLTGTSDPGAEWYAPETHSRIRREGK